MQVKLRDLWESGGSLQRFAQFKFKGSAICWKAGRICHAALREIEKLQKDRAEMEQTASELRQEYGEEIETRNNRGEMVKVFHVPANAPRYQKWKEQAKNLEQHWEESLDVCVEIIGEHYKPFSIDDLPEEFWGCEEEKDADGKIVKPAVQAMMSNEDIGALATWMISGPGEPVKTQAAAGD